MKDYNITAILIAVLIIALIVVLGLWSNNQYQAEQDKTNEASIAKVSCTDSIKHETLNSHKQTALELDTLQVQVTKLVTSIDSTITLQNKIIQNQRKALNKK